MNPNKQNVKSCGFCSGKLADQETRMGLLAEAGNSRCAAGRIVPRYADILTDVSRMLCQ